MLKIAEKLDFQAGIRVEVYQRNDNQPPNSFFAIIVAEIFFKKSKNLDFSR